MREDFFKIFPIKINRKRQLFPINYSGGYPSRLNISNKFVTGDQPIIWYDAFIWGGKVMIEWTSNIRD